MNYEFADFIKKYTNNSFIIDKLDDFVGNNHGKFVNLSGSSSTLGRIFHENIQTCLCSIITSQLKTKIITELEISEEIEKEQLFKRLVKDIQKNAVITEEAKFSEEDVAKYFIKEIFDPLLASAKKFSL